MRCGGWFGAGLLFFSVACGGEGGGGDAGTCQPSARCGAGELRVEASCEGCREIDDGCGGTIVCAPDPTCEVPCPAGEYEVFGACPDQSCVERTACGEPVLCRSQNLCLSETTCPDGGYLLDACPGGTTQCLPYQACGLKKYCAALDGCQAGACAPGESPTILSCSDPSIDLPCREVAACGGTVRCVCHGARNLCRDDETLDTSPCTPGQECRTFQVCGETVYCKGDSI